MTRDELQALGIALIAEAPGGFTLPEFRDYVREHLGQHLSKREAQEVLKDLALRLTAGEDGVFRSAATGQAAAAAGEDVRAGSFVVFDIETRGADRQTAQIIQLAALKVESWTPGPRLNLFVSGVTLDELTIDITHITQAEVDAGVSLLDALEQFRAFAGALPLAGHNVSTFDVPILQRSAGEVGVDLGRPEVLDTLALAEILDPRLESYRLEDLIEVLEGQAHEDAHRADADVDANFRLLVALQGQWAALSSLEAGILSRLQFAELALLPPRPLTVPATALPTETVLPVDSVVGWTQPAAPESAQVFSAGGLLSRVFPGYEPRSTQVEMARLVEDTLSRGGTAVIEAPTGTGKTKAYLVPAAATANGSRSDRPLVVVSTHTKALQAQALREAEELNAMGVTFRAALFKGVANYLCPLRLSELTAEVEVLSPAERRVAAYLTRWTQLGEGDLERVHGWWSGQRATKEVLHRVRTDSSLCSPECPFTERCGFQERNRNLKTAHVVITNHAATFMALPALLDDPAVSDPRPLSVVFDEAHNLEDAARSAFTVELDSSEVWALLAELSRQGGGYLAWLERRRPDLKDALTEVRHGVEAARARLPMLEQAIQSWAVQADRNGSAAYGWNFELLDFCRTLERWGAVREHLIHLKEALIRIARALRAVRPAMTAQGRAILRRLDDPDNDTDLLKRLGLFRRTDEENDQETQAVLVTASDQGWNVQCVPLNLQGHLSGFYARADSLVFTSATLRLRRSFAHLRQTLALSARDDVQELALAPVLPYGNARILLPWHLPPPSRAYEERFVDSYATELGNSLQVTQGRSLALFASRDRMNRVFLKTARFLENRLPLLVQGRGPRDSLVRTFREEKRSSLFGLRSMMEGVDVPGDSLVAVHLEKIPFPVVRALERALERYYSATGRSWWDEYYLPRGIIPFVQSFGRLIRAQSDRGAFVVWDRRVSGAFYWDHFLDSLPLEPEQLEQVVVTPTSRLDFFRHLGAATGFPLDEETLGDLHRSPAEATLDRLRVQEKFSDDDLRTALREVWGHQDFRPFQLAAVRDALNDRSLLLVMPTGGGKSLTFQLPALLQSGLTIVVSPLISLMQDQHGELVRAGVTSAAALYGGMSQGDQADVLRAVERGEQRLLYLSPERLFESQELRALLGRIRVRRVVVDEAHCVSMWGHGFRPEYLLIQEALMDLQLQVPVTAVTATATPPVERDILDALSIPSTCVRRLPVERINLALGATRISGRTQRLTTLIDLARRGPFPLLIYSTTVREVGRLHAALSTIGVSVGQYHGQLSSFERSEAQEAFLNDEIDVLVATKAFGMGINKLNVRQVVHAQLPDALESYVQEVGRAGRDGAPATGLLLHAAQDLGLQRLFTEKAFPEEREIERVLEWISGHGPVPFTGHVQLQEDAPLLGLEERQLQMAVHALHRGGALQSVRSVPARVQVRLIRSSVLPADLTELLKSFLPDPDQEGTLLGNLLAQPDAVGTYARLTGCPGLRVRPLSRALSVQVKADPADWRNYLQTFARQAEQRLGHLLAYVGTQGCRHVRISQHFGERSALCQTRCDNCDAALRQRATALSPDVRSALGIPNAIRQAVRFCEEHRALVGRVKLMMLLKGLRQHRGATLRPLYLRCPVYGRLDLLNEGDLEREIQGMIDRGQLISEPIPSASGGHVVRLP